MEATPAYAGLRLVPPGSDCWFRRCVIRKVPRRVSWVPTGRPFALGRASQAYGINVASSLTASIVPSAACRLPPTCVAKKRGLLFRKGATGENGRVGAVADAEKQQGWEKTAESFGEVVSSAFPLWVAIACGMALAWPNATLWIDGRIQVVGISVTMLGMGMTLTPEDFRGALAMPKELLIGTVLQYTVMPTLGYVVSRLLQLPPYYAAGLILVACCPGGTASNIVTYLARGDVALSVLMTAASTFLAVIMTPLLTSKLVGQYIAVDAFALFSSTVQVVLLPVVLGAVMNHFFKKAVRKISLFAPSIAVAVVAVLCAGAVGRSATAILSSGGQIFLAVGLLHGLGFCLGYILSHVLGLKESVCRTISIEVGMQNSVLGVVLAGQHFVNPLSAVPCAISSVCHSVFGSSLARMWRLNLIKEDNVEDLVKG